MKKMGTDRKKKRSGQKNETYDFAWELMLPVLLTVCVLPLLVRFSLYDSGLGGYAWYAGSDGIRTDLFALGKSRFFVLLVFFMVLILGFRAVLARSNRTRRKPGSGQIGHVIHRKFLQVKLKERTDIIESRRDKSRVKVNCPDARKEMKCFLPLCGYAGMVILSGIFAQNPEAAVYGNMETFESVFVLLGYPVLAVYVYLTMRDEKYFRILQYGLAVVFALLSVTGVLQIFHVHLLTQTWFQKWIMSPEDFAVYGGTLTPVFIGSYVYASLYNPSYAGIWFGMLFFIWMVLFLTEREQKRKILYAVGTVLSLVLLWFTRSRSAVAALAAGIFAFLLLAGNRQRKWMLTRMFPGILLTGAVLIAVDAMAGFPFLSRFAEKNEREPLESLLTTPDGVWLVYADHQYQIDLDSSSGKILINISEPGQERIVLPENESSEPEQERTVLPENESSKPEQERIVLSENESCELLPGEELRVHAYPSQNAFLLHIADQDLSFEKSEEEGWRFLTPWGVRERLLPVAHVDFHGLEYLGSARGYIWSRSLPLLPKRLLIGSGPDSFAEQFPQNDYAGKAVYADRVDRVIEKGHNDILTKWVQTGGLSVLFLLLFYLQFLRYEYQYCSRWLDQKNPFQGRRQKSMPETPVSLSERIGLGAFLACVFYLTSMLFHDGSLQVTPLFWVFLGTAMASSHVERLL